MVCLTNISINILHKADDGNGDGGGDDTTEINNGKIWQRNLL
jgi:hypothetical protein